MSPSRNSLRPVARVRFPPPLSPATMTRDALMPNSAAFPATHFRPETQSLRPAGNGSISGTEEGVSALRKSTIATATPRAAMILPQAR